MHILIDDFKFTNKIKIIFVVVFLLLLSSSFISIYYLNNIKVFSEYTTAKYLKCMDLAYQLERSSLNEESLLSKSFLSSTPTYIFSLQQSHYDLKQAIDDLEQYAFDDSLKENIKLLKEHENDLNKMLQELWNSGSLERAKYESISSQYTFIKNTSADIVSYVSDSYDTARAKSIEIIIHSIIITTVLSTTFLIIFVICFIQMLRISKDIELRTILDPLTGLFNRRAFDNKLQQLCNQTNNKITFSLLMIDIDFFKKVNDTYGHQTGDKVLIDIANLLTMTVRSRDFVARYGGEEMTILLAYTDLDQAYLLAERLRKAVEDYIFVAVDGTKLHVTISMGVSQVNKEKPNCDIVGEADSALYDSKSNGRNQVTAYKIKNVMEVNP
jgi:diguanylate cyclase (GGDEF)-like protein